MQLPNTNHALPHYGLKPMNCKHTGPLAALKPWLSKLNARAASGLVKRFSCSCPSSRILTTCYAPQQPMNLSHMSKKSLFKASGTQSPIIRGTWTLRFLGHQSSREASAFGFLGQFGSEPRLYKCSGDPPSTLNPKTPIYQGNRRAKAKG